MMIKAVTLMRSSLRRGVSPLMWRHLSTASTELPHVTLYQYNICPFCHKTKAVMAFVGIRPNIMEVNPLTKAGLPKDYRKVPIAIIDEEQIKGSDEIIQALLDHPAVQRQISDNDFASSQWVEFANKDLGALLYPNICSSLSESYKAFGYVDNIDSFSLLQKFSIKALGSVAMYMAASRIKGKLGIRDERAALQEALQTFQQEGLGNQKKFSSGKDNPDLGDLVVYGTLRSVEGLPAHARVIMENEENQSLREWYFRVKERLLPY